MTAQEYLAQTEQAAKQLFNALQYYQRLLKGVLGPSFVSNASDDKKREKEFQDWYEKNRDAIEAARRRQREYLGQTISEGAICGSILQIAFMGIKSFSKQKVLPDGCQGLLKKDDYRVTFCVGREIRGVPIGLIIYAARNQYNHLDEKLNNNVAQAVFERIATHRTGGKYKDPAFDLDNAVLENYSHNIVNLLDWNNYDAYLNDIKKVILYERSGTSVTK